MATAKQKAMVAAMLAEHTPMDVGDTVEFGFMPFKGDVFGSTSELYGFYDWQYDTYRIGSYDAKTGMYSVRDDDGETAKVPFYCLKLVRKNDGRTFMVGSEEANINTTGTLVEVGCQTVKFEEVKTVYEAMLKLQAAKAKLPKKVAAKTTTKKKAK